MGRGFILVVTNHFILTVPNPVGLWVTFKFKHIAAALYTPEVIFVIFSWDIIAGILSIIVYYSCCRRLIVPFEEFNYFKWLWLSWPCNLFCFSWVSLLLFLVLFEHINYTLSSTVLGLVLFYLSIFTWLLHPPPPPQETLIVIHTWCRLWLWVSNGRRRMVHVYLLVHSQYTCTCSTFVMHVKVEQLSHYELYPGIVLIHSLVADLNRSGTFCDGTEVHIKTWTTLLDNLCAYTYSNAI